MAIKIIEERDPEHVKRVTCRNCAVRLEYTMADTRKKSSTDYTGSTDYYTVLDCPNCKKTIQIK